MPPNGGQSGQLEVEENQENQPLITWYDKMQTKEMDRILWGFLEGQKGVKGRDVWGVRQVKPV